MARRLVVGRRSEDDHEHGTGVSRQLRLGLTSAAAAMRREGLVEDAFKLLVEHRLVWQAGHHPHPVVLCSDDRGDYDAHRP